jgi:hypothetical protein
MLIRDAAERILQLQKYVLEADQNFTGSPFCLDHSRSLLGIMIDTLRVTNTLTTHDKAIVADLFAVM